MKFIISVFTLSLLCFCSSCTNVVSTTPAEEHFPKPAEVLKDYSTWYAYHYSNIHLAQDFIGLDAEARPVDKGAFLEQLAEGNLIALQTASKNDTPVYKLHKPETSHPDIESTSKQLALNELANFRMEGKELPEYAFTDLEGNRYTKANTKGKLLVVKCWFIRCVACVKEFPELNELVTANKQREDILFLSLAMDDAPALKAFLTKRLFHYAVVANQDKYMSEALGITQYPTHLLVNSEGIVVKVVNTVDDLKPFFNKEAGKLSP
jgi:peroxiredoxin